MSYRNPYNPYNDPYNNGPYNPVIGFVNTTPQTNIIYDARTGQAFLHQRNTYVVTPQNNNCGSNSNNGNNRQSNHSHTYTNSYSQSQNANRNSHSHSHTHTHTHYGNNHNGYTPNNGNQYGNTIPVLSPAQLMNQVMSLRDGYHHPF